MIIMMGFVFYVPFNILSHNEAMEGANEKLCAMQRPTVMNWIPPPVTGV